MQATVRGRRGVVSSIAHRYAWREMLLPPGVTGQSAFADGVPLAAGADATPDLRLMWMRDPEPRQLLALRDEIGPKAVSLLVGPLSRQLRARIDRVGETFCLTLRPARYVDETERVIFGSLQLVIHDDLVVLIARGGCFELDAWVRELTGRTDLLAGGPNAIAHAAIRRVLDDYEPVLTGLENDIDEIEDQVFGTHGSPVRRIYELLREVIAFQRATRPLDELLATLERRHAMTETVRASANGDAEATSALVTPPGAPFSDGLSADAQLTSERAASYRALLENVLNVNLALETKRLSEVAIDQTEQTKKISAWAAILFTPSLVAGVYGMNFRRMPELLWGYGYPFALSLMLILCMGLYTVFKRRDWI